MNRLVVKIRAIYPDRTKKLGVAEYIKITLIDFGWFIVLFYLYAFTRIHWSDSQIIIRTECINFSLVGLAMLVHFFILEIFMAMMVKLRLRLKGKKGN